MAGIFGLDDPAGVRSATQGPGAASARSSDGGDGAPSPTAVAATAAVVAAAEVVAAAAAAAGEGAAAAAEGAVADLPFLGRGRELPRGLAMGGDPPPRRAGGRRVHPRGCGRPGGGARSRPDPRRRAGAPPRHRPLAGERRGARSRAGAPHGPGGRGGLASLVLRAHRLHPRGRGRDRPSDSAAVYPRGGGGRGPQRGRGEAAPCRACPSCWRTSPIRSCCRMPR